MKTTIRDSIFVLLAVGGMVLLGGNAHARISMPEKEHAQTLVLILEFVSFATAVAIALFVWQISKRDSKNKKSRRDDA